MSAAVADAGPLIHLAEIGQLLLLTIFDTLHIGDIVWSETVGRNRVPDPAVVSLGTVQRHTAPESDVGRFVEENDLRATHAGERESLYLCAALQVHLVLTDDLAVRAAAARLNVTPVGSLGIVA